MKGGKEYEQKPTSEQIEAVRDHFFVPGYPYPPRTKSPLRELSEAEKEMIAVNRAAVYQHMPDMLPFFKELHDEGMIDGWRGVGEVELLNEGDGHGND